MKIDNLFKPVTVGPGSDARVRASKSADSSAATSSSSEVTLSPLSSQLAALDAKAGSGVSDPARIAEIKEAIANGQFKVNAEAIADRLLGNAREMLARGKG